jgi:hypothetical protein
MNIYRPLHYPPLVLGRQAQNSYKLQPTRRAATPGRGGRDDHAAEMRLEPVHADGVESATQFDDVVFGGLLHDLVGALIKRGKRRRPDIHVKGPFQG